MGKLSKQALDGNVETILLSELVEGPSYGYALVREINRKHEGLLALGEGTIYPVLYRMEEKGLVRPEQRKMDSGRNRKYYHLTQKGRRVLANNLQQWDALSQVMDPIRQSLPAKRALGGAV